MKCSTFQRSRLVLISLMVLLFSACSKETPRAPIEALIRPVKLITVKAADEGSVNQFPAVVGANRLSELSLQVGGQLIEFPATPARAVAAGALIAKLDPRDFETALDSAKAQYRNANEEYQRAVRLRAGDAIAQTVLEQRKAQFEVSKAQLEQAEKALSDTELRAPFSGVVAETLVKNLQTVSPGEPLVRLMSEELFEATIDLPASFIARIPKEAAERNNGQAFVILDAAPNQLIAAEFKEANLIADASSQTYSVTFTFPPPANINVLPGMNATVELRRSLVQETTRVALPLQAVVSDGQSHYVWIVDPASMTVAKRPVEYEAGVGETLVVTRGLQADDVIAGAGAAYLTEGLKVRAWE